MSTLHTQYKAPTYYACNRPQHYATPYYGHTIWPYIVIIICVAMGTPQYVGFQAKTRFRAFFSEMEISQLVHDLCDAHQVVQYRVRFPFHVRDMGLGFTLLNIND